jgi:hypothetical protein
MFFDGKVYCCSICPTIASADEIEINEVPSSSPELISIPLLLKQQAA